MSQRMVRAAARERRGRSRRNEVADGMIRRERRELPGIPSSQLLEAILEESKARERAKDSREARDLEDPYEGAVLYCLQLLPQIQERRPCSSSSSRARSCL